MTNQERRKHIAERLKQYHDWECKALPYSESIFGVAAMLLEEDAVEVVRCKDCKKRGTEDCAMTFDTDYYLTDWTLDDGFCSWGERKEDE